MQQNSTSQIAPKLISFWQKKGKTAPSIVKHKTMKFIVRMIPLCHYYTLPTKILAKKSLNDFMFGASIKALKAKQGMGEKNVEQP